MILETLELQAGKEGRAMSLGKARVNPAASGTSPILPPLPNTYNTVTDFTKSFPLAFS